MGFVEIIVLALIVAGIAFVLGKVWQRREQGGGPSVVKPATPQIKNTLKQYLERSTDDHDTQSLVNWLLTQAFEQTGVKVADDRVAYQRIVEAAQKALVELRTKETVTINLPFLTADSSGPKHFTITLTREVMQELARY
jgi:hypothetical protein